jgi:hypothetical protein
MRGFGPGFIPSINRMRGISFQGGYIRGELIGVSEIGTTDYADFTD